MTTTRSCIFCGLVGRKRLINIVDHMQSQKMIEEALRPNLPAKISSTSTWLLTAKDLMDNQPLVYSTIVARLADGDTVAQIVKLTKQPVELIRKIRDLHPDVLAVGKRVADNMLQESYQAAAKRLADNIHKIPMAQLPVATAILHDKVALITGGVTSRSESRVVKSPDQMKEYFDSIAEANATVVIEDKK